MNLGAGIVLVVVGLALLVWWWLAWLESSQRRRAPAWCLFLAIVFISGGIWSALA